VEVVPLRAEPRREEALQLVLALLGGVREDGRGLAQKATERQKERPGRSLADASLDVVSCALLAAGTDEAHRQILHIWAPKVARWSRAAANARVDPDDVTQEVLCRLAAHLPQHRDGLALGQWLWRATWLVLREGERRSWWGRWVSEVRVLAGLEDPAPSAPQALHEAERTEAVRVILQELALEQRLLLWAAYVEGCDRATLASRFGWPQGTLNRRLTQAREAFRQAALARGLEGVMP
jgi:RNA polymerase sigma factor (sigma-70 family)